MLPGSIGGRVLAVALGAEVRFSVVVVRGAMDTVAGGDGFVGGLASGSLEEAGADEATGGLEEAVGGAAEALEIPTSTSAASACVS